MTKRWAKILLIWAAILLTIGLIICIVLLKYASIYDQTRPEPIIDELINRMTFSDWYNAAIKNCSFEVNEFENPTDLYVSYIQDSKIDESKITYRKEVTLSDENKTVYSIRSGISAIANVTLIPDDTRNYGFGRHTWKLGYISAPNIIKNINSVTVNIYAPTDSTIFVNGIEVDSKYVVDYKASVPGLNKFETNMKTDLNYIKYDLGKMYGKIVVIDSTGEEISATENNDGSVSYIVRPDELINVKITAPDDVDITINGLIVDKSEGISSNTLFKDILQYTEGDEYSVVTYSFSDFIKEPDVKAVDKDGNVLVPIVSGNKRYSFMHLNEPATQAQFQEVVQSFFEKYRLYATSVYNSGTAGSLLNRCLRHSELYDYILNSEDTMYWTTAIKTTYSDVTYDNYSMVGDRAFVCAVKYRIEQTSTDWNETTEKYLDYAYELVFVKSDEMWLCAKMEAISE